MKVQQHHQAVLPGLEGKTPQREVAAHHVAETLRDQQALWMKDVMRRCPDGAEPAAAIFDQVVQHFAEHEGTVDEASARLPWLLAPASQWAELASIPAGLAVAFALGLGLGLDAAIDTGVLAVPAACLLPFWIGRRATPPVRRAALAATQTLVRNDDPEAKAYR